MQPSIIAAKFHNTLVEIIVAVTKKSKQNRVILSGGCFQNVYLTEHTVKRLREEGCRPYWHQRVPPNDGGIALGQAYAVLRKHRYKCDDSSRPLKAYSGKIRRRKKHLDC